MFIGLLLFQTFTVPASAQSPDPAISEVIRDFIKNNTRISGEVSIRDIRAVGQYR
jgi:hypothetical protein